MMNDKKYKKEEAFIIHMSGGTKKGELIILTVLIIFLLLNFFIRPHEPHFIIDGWPGFWAVFGIVITWILTRVAKGVAHLFLSKDEDFYIKNEEK